MKIFAAAFLLLTALLLSVLETMALIDPVGAKMADDADPFGPPAPWHVHAVWIAIIMILVISAIALVRHGKQDY